MNSESNPSYLIVRCMIIGEGEEWKELVKDVPVRSKPHSLSGEGKKIPY